MKCNLQKRKGIEFLNPLQRRSDWIRTSDPLNPIQVRYQAAPRSDRPII